MSPLVLGPLMHGGGQWLTLIALFGGNRAVVYTDRDSTRPGCSTSR